MPAPAALLLVLAPLVMASPQERAGSGAGVLESDACARCHANAANARAMRDGEGRGVAPFDLWRTSMMANAARDPFWRAQVAAEVEATPARGREIEEKCLSCHAPMLVHTGLDDHGADSALHALDCEGRAAELGRDGVSCTICHGITPEGLGSEASFSGRFELDPERRLFGPHADPFWRPMRMHTGFTPTEAAHIGAPALCGSCHTLFTRALEPDGSETDDVFAEQTPYLEWRNSDYAEEGDERGPLAATCQDCHLPTDDVDGHPVRTRIAHNPGGRDWPMLGERSPFGRHLFAGGNTLVPALLRDHAAELGAEASAAAFDARLEATRRQLLGRTATLELTGLERRGAELRFRVRVTNRTGHKLPTGHPSRRVWLRAVVRGADGRVLVASGAVDERGRILGGDGAPLPSELGGGPIAPHRDEVAGPGEVALFRGVMHDRSGRPTFSLLRAARWGIDDRLLPAGWSEDHPDATWTRPYGVANDATFVGGSDEVRYRLAVPEQGPLRVELALLQQTLSARWAAELFLRDAPEVRRFEDLVDPAELEPEVLARALAEVR